jgi:hypothetical protein
MELTELVTLEATRALAERASGAADERSLWCRRMIALCAELRELREYRAASALADAVYALLTEGTR